MRWLGVVTDYLPASQDWTFERVPGGYESRCADLGITITVDEIDYRRDELTALVSVRSTMIGLRTVNDNVLKTGKFNLLAARTRGDFAKSVGSRCPGEASKLDWDGFFERLVSNILTAERYGEPAVVLADVELVDTDQYLIGNLLTAGNDPSIWFGDGGSMKSYLALAACLTIATGSPAYMGEIPTKTGNVGYVDWEFSPQGHRRRMGALCGDGKFPRNVYYVRADRPLTQEVNRLQRLVREHNLMFLVLDSVVVGCDGPAEQTDTVGRYVLALRKLNIPVLLIAHMTKAEEGDKKPLGSVMWHNSAGVTWFIKKGEQVGEKVTVGMFNRKNREERDAPPRAFSFWFQREFGRAVISPATYEEINAEPSIAEKLPLRFRVETALRSGPMTVAQIAIDLDHDLSAVSKVIRKGMGSAFTRVPGKDGVERVALLSFADGGVH